MSALLSMTTSLRRWLGLPPGPDDTADGEQGSSRHGWAPGSPSARLDRDIDDLRRRLDAVEGSRHRASGQTP